VNVYCIYFKNGKRYVGVEAKHGARITFHSRGYNSKSKNPQVVTKAISKYGWDTCKWRYLITNASKEDAFKLEKFFIKQFQTQDREKGYNICAGGRGGSGYPVSLQTRQKLSIINKGKKLSLETRAKMRGRCGPKPWLRGFPGPRKPVICMETGDIYDSAMNAAKDMGMSHGSKISAACVGKRLTAAGYHWSHLIKI
jgi:hypothetical protein